MLRVVEHLVGEARSRRRGRRCITIMRCASRRATARSCVTMMAASCSCRVSSRSRSSRRACTETSRPEVGSSMNTRRGRVTRLRAICRRCCMPPEKVRGDVVDALRIDLDALHPLAARRRAGGRSGARPAPSGARRRWRRPTRPCAGRRPAFWCTKPQSVRASRRCSASLIAQHVAAGRRRASGTARCRRRAGARRDGS